MHWSDNNTYRRLEKILLDNIENILTLLIKNNVAICFWRLGDGGRTEGHGESPVVDRTGRWGIRINTRACPVASGFPLAPKNT